MALDLGESYLADQAKECAKKAACPDFASGTLYIYIYI